jgi:Flp pilus assembly protein CpaB
MSHALIDLPTFLVRSRRWLARRSVRRSLAAIVALLAGLAGVAVVQAAEQGRERWGSVRTVVVARRDLAFGERVDAGAVELRELPDAAVTRAALSEIPVGAVVRQPIAEGEPLIAERLAPDGLSGVAALVPPGWRAVAVPLGPAGVPPVQVGDLVDVVAVMAAATGISGHGHDVVSEAGGGAATGEPAVPLVERATVVDVGDDTVSVAVPAIDVPPLVAGLSQGAVVLTLAGA